VLPTLGGGPPGAPDAARRSDGGEATGLAAVGARVEAKAKAKAGDAGKVAEATERPPINVRDSVRGTWFPKRKQAQTSQDQFVWHVPEPWAKGVVVTSTTAFASSGACHAHRRRSR
jgi:hypothetical protein